MGKWLSWARHGGGAFAFAFVWWEMEIEMSSTEELQGVRRERGNGVLIRVAVNYVYESLQSPMSSVIKEQNCWLIALSHWVVVLVSDTILRPNHIWLSFIRVPPLLMNLGTDSAASNTPVSWLFVSPATHRHSRTLDPVITRNCSTSEITPHTSHSLLTVSSPHPLPTCLHHTSPLTPLRTSSPWIPILLPKHPFPFLLLMTPTFSLKENSFFLPCG